MLNTIAEMTIAFPESGNFISYADRWVDPALSFAVGFAEWLGTRFFGYNVEQKLITSPRLGHRGRS
jgi:amino acid permease